MAVILCLASSKENYIFDSYQKLKKRQKDKGNTVKQVLTSSCLSSMQHSPIYHSNLKRKCFLFRTDIVFWMARTTISILVWHLWNGLEKAKSISVRRPGFVIRIGLLWQAASYGSWHRHSLKETGMKGWRRSRRSLLDLLRKVITPSTSQQPSFPSSLHVSC